MIELVDYRVRRILKTLDILVGKELLIKIYLDTAISSFIFTNVSSQLRDVFPSLLSLFRGRREEVRSLRVVQRLLHE